MEIISLEMLQGIIEDIAPNCITIAIIFYLLETLLKFTFSIIFPRRFSGFNI